MVSKLSYDEILNKLNKVQKKVFDVIKEKGNVSNEDIAIELDKYPHEVTPRTLELRDMKLVELAGEGIAIKSKRPVCLWRIKPNQEKIIF